MKIQPFGEVLREIRENFGISMRALASSAEMDPAYLSKLENGKTGTPKQKTVEHLAHKLCDQQQLEKDECEHLTRQLLEASGHLQNREELLNDLEKRFGDRLRTEGFPENKIDEVLASVPLATMRKVLLGEESLEIGYWSELSREQVQARKDSGEEVITIGLESSPDTSHLIKPSLNVEETASGYLDQHAREFVTHRRQKRARSNQGPRKIIRAGREAEIHVHCSVSKEQEQQLRLISKLITTILEEKTL